MGVYDLVGPVLRCLDAETAHGLTITALKSGLVPKATPINHPSLGCKLWGLDFPNPLGLAAGFDKNAEVPDAMLAQGFGHVEVGSITPRAQPGNPKPRLFRLKEDTGVINRMGFNNLGAEAARRNLENRRSRHGIVGVNLGKNKDTEDAADDYVKGIQQLGNSASYMVVNVSSPNTPGLRALQGREPLEHLLTTVRCALNETVPTDTPPLLLKIAPDLTDEDKADIAVVVKSTGVDGLIATNTTITRPDTLRGSAKTEAGGLSGKPLADLSTGIIRDMYRLLDGTVPIIGVGGIHDADSAYAKIRAGASLIQLYSAMVYHGPELVPAILRGLIARLDADGYGSVSDAVGADARQR
jgi:dihydroorotate dehydrogenase